MPAKRLSMRTIVYVEGSFLPTRLGSCGNGQWNVKCDPETTLASLSDTRVMQAERIGQATC